MVNVLYGTFELGGDLGLDVGYLLCNTMRLRLLLVRGIYMWIAVVSGVTVDASHSFEL
jgi:hypothetical protein